MEDSVEEFFEQVLDLEEEKEVVAILTKVMAEEHKINNVGDLMACFSRGEDEIQSLLRTVNLDRTQIDSVKEALQEIADDEEEESEGDGDSEEEEETKEEGGAEPLQGLLSRRSSEMEGSSKENEAPINEEAGNRLQIDGRAQAKPRIGGGVEANGAKGPSPYALTEKGEK